MGTCNGSSGSKYDLWIEATQNSQSVTANTSNVTVALKLKRNDGYASSAYNLNTDENSVVLKVGGSTKVNTTLKIDTRNSATVTLATWTGDVTHNSDGTLKLSLSGSFTMAGTSLSGGSVSGSFTCTTIKRASTLTIGATSVVPGGSFDFGISGVTNFTHKITCQIGSNEKITTNCAANVQSGKITIPESWASYLPNAQSGTIKVVLYTYSGSTQIGSKSYNLKITIPDNDTFRPSFELVLNKIENGYSNENYYLSGVNQVETVLSSIVYKYGATLKSISVKFGGITATENNAVFEIIGSGTQTVTARVTDSRGYYAELTKDIEVKGYEPPWVNITKLERCDAEGNPVFDGTSLKISYETSSYSKLGVHSPSFDVREIGGDIGQTIRYPAFSTPNPAIINGVLESSKSYQVRVSLSDGIRTGSDTRKIGTAKVPFNIKKGGTGAAFGGYAETDNELTVHYDLQVKGNIVYKDITDNAVINSEYFQDLKTEIRHYPCLDMTFLHLRATVKKTIPADTAITVMTISEDVELGNNPNITHPLSICTNVATANKSINAYITYYGEVRFLTGQEIAVGKKIYIKDFWFTTGSEEEES